MHTAQLTRHSHALPLVKLETAFVNHLPPSPSREQNLPWSPVISSFRPSRVTLPVDLPRAQSVSLSRSPTISHHLAPPPTSAEASPPAPCVPRCPCRRSPRRPRRSPARSRRRSRSISPPALAVRPRPEQLRHLRLAFPLCEVQGRVASLRAHARRGDERTHDALSRRDERSEGRRRGHPTPARTPSRVAHTRERSTHAATLTLVLIVGSAPRSSRRRVTSRCPSRLE